MKKRLMKRGLSLVLAFVMMFGMIQTPLFTQEVQAAAGDASDGSYDYDVSKMKVAAGSIEPNGGDGEGSIFNAFDNDANTIWHSLWNPEGANENLWVVMALEEKTEIDAVRWQSRGHNGDVTGYEIFGTTDIVNINEDDGNDKNNTILNDADINWTSIMTGTWTAGDKWNIAEFTPQKLTAIKVVVVNSVGDGNRDNYFASAKEIRVRTTVKAPVDPIPVSAKPANGTTSNQPFASGTAGSTYFRIPALITTKDGTLVAAADARWETINDALGIDIMVSTSTNAGGTWNYTFANYLGDYGDGIADPATNKAYAATFIDPELAYDPNEGENGTIYMLADLYAGGYAINTAPMTPVSGSAFTDNGYLKLKASDATSYDYYLKDGKIYPNNSTTAVEGYTVDGYFNLLYNGAAAGNLFFNSSIAAQKPAYQVLPTTYLYLTKSVDNGVTWSEPQLLNVKEYDEYFYGVGPGRGLVTADGTIMFSCYEFAGTDAQRASFIYSTDDGATWHRTPNATSSIWSSENQLVELADGTIRMFFRSAQRQVCYIDATGNGTDGYVWSSKGVQNTGLYSCSNTQMSAIKYSKRIDGKEAIIVSYPASSNSSGDSNWDRTNGRISIGLVNSDGSMEWKYTYNVNNANFWYSCLTELNDHSIGLLHEYGQSGAYINYANYSLSTIAPNAKVGGYWVVDATNKDAGDVTMSPGATATYSIYGQAAGNLTVTSSDTNVATVTLNGAATAAANDTAVATFTVTANANLVGFGTTTITVSDGTESTSFKVKVLSGTTENYETVELKVGEKATFTDKTGYYVGQETGVDSSKATVEMTGKENARVAAAQLATALGNFNGSYIDLNDCLYTFTGTGTTNQYTISSTTDAGATVYLNISGGTATLPNNDTAKAVTLHAGATAGTINFHDGTANLHFHKDSGYYFNKCTSNNVTADGGKHEFEVYRPVIGATSGNIIGFEQVTSVSAVTDGKYLIAALADDGNRYVLRPYTGNSGSDFNHVAKVTTGYFERSVQVGASVANDTNVSFTNGTIRGLSELLYTFEEVTDTAGNSGYRVFVKNEDNTPRLYLSLRKSGNVDGRRPHMAEDGSVIQFTNVSGNEGSYIIKDAKGWSNNGENGSHLHFYAAASKNHHSFDRCGTVGSSDIENHTYRIYRPVKNNETASTELPGYVRVMSLDSIENGGQYLIAVYDDNTLFFLNPPANANDANYLHVAQLTNGIVATNSGTTDITITGVAAGNTTAVIGDTTYYITVTEVEKVKKEIILGVGESKILEGTTSQTPADPSVVSVVSDQTGHKKYTYAEVDQIADGRYLIGRDAKCMSDAYYNSNQNLTMVAFAEAEEWLLTKVDGGYTIQNEEGKYLNLNSSNNVVLGDSPLVFTLESNTAGGFGIKTGSRYLNNSGNSNTYITTWNDNDAGSNLFLYRSLEGTFSVTGEKMGTTTMSTDTVDYTFIVGKYIDYTVLNQQINIAEALENDTTYTTESLNNLKTVLAEAQAFNQITTIFTSAEEAEVAQKAADAMADKLIAAVRALQKNMKSISMTVGQQAEYVVNGELTGYDDAEALIAAVSVDETKTKMTVAGLEVGFIKMMVGTTEYNVVISPVADGFPIKAGTGQGNGKVVTKLTISADNSFDFNYDGTGTVTWSTPTIDGVTLNADGTISFDSTKITTTVTTTVTATTESGTYTVPVIIHPAPTSTNKRLTNLYIDEITNLEVYYTWNCGTDFIHAAIGEAIYYSNNVAEPIAIDFFGAPWDGYALTYMSSTNSQSHYMTVHEGDDKTLDTSGKGFLNYYDKDGNEGAGVTQKGIFGEEQVMAMLYQGIIRYSDGVMGFTRRVDASSNIDSVLKFQAEKLPTIEKTVHGILPADTKRVGYRPYVEGMVATEGEYVYFQVTVRTYRPLTFKPDTTDQSMIVYTNAMLTDDILKGASFITDKGKETILLPDQIIPNPAITEEDITTALNAQRWAADEQEKELTYYVAYKITAEDLGSDIINTADLAYNYKAQYSTGDFDAIANADAKITVADYVEKELVVDFGLPVSVTLPTWGKIEKVTDGVIDYDIVRLDTTGSAKANYGSVVVEELKTTDNSTTTGWKVTYTPNTTLKGTDTITLYENVGNEKRMPAQYKIKVHPASTVYYEENFMIPSADGQWAFSQTFDGVQEAAQPGYTLQVPSANYGHDAVYANKVATEAVSSITQEEITAAGDLKEKATFTFTGTGVDVFANCDTTTGIVMVMVKDSTGTLKKMYTVDTKLNLGTIDTNAAALGSETTNIPIVSIPADGLTHGEYQVQLIHTPKKVTTETTVEGKVEKVVTTEPTNLRIDGFRVYGTLSDAEALAVHGRDNEAFPLYKDIKDSVMAGMTIDFKEGEYKEQLANNLLSQVYAANGEKVGGALLVTKGTTNQVYMSDELKADFLDNTSKNELYVYPGQSLVLPLEAAVKNPQLAMKALNGTAKYTITKTAGQTTETGAETEIIANTEMYYLLSMLQDADKNQLATTFTITNTGTTAIAVTKLKVIVDKDVATPTVFAELTEDDLMPALAAFDAETPEDGGEQLPQGPVVNRIAGSDRYETAYKVADALKETLGVDKFDVVIVATGKNFADALSGSYLATVKNAPILLTNEKRVDELAAYVKANLAENGTVYVLGGAAAVPETVEASLEGYAVERLAGATRYETNIAILKEAGFADETGMVQYELLIATGRNFADSLSASATKKPILLVKDEITEAHEEILSQFANGKIYILGGAAAVPETVEAGLEGYVVERLAGATRYETSVKVAEAFFPDAQAVVLAYAKEFPDGLAGGSLAATMNAPLILAADGKTADAAGYVQTKGIQTGIVLGGTARISDEAVEEIF